MRAPRIYSTAAWTRFDFSKTATWLKVCLRLQEVLSFLNHLFRLQRISLWHLSKSDKILSIDDKLSFSLLRLEPASTRLLFPCRLTRLAIIQGNRLSCSLAFQNLKPKLNLLKGHQLFSVYRKSRFLNASKSSEVIQCFSRLKRLIRRSSTFRAAARLSSYNKAH